LNGYEFMPLLVARFLGSEFFAVATLEERAVGMTLWFQSWHQQPAGSLPNNDRHLCHLAHCDFETWKRVKRMALHKWKQYSDNRLYHPVITQEVIKAWEYRQEHQRKLSQHAEKMRRLRDKWKLERAEDVPGTDTAH
jgi:uncharacterized protein DUF1376